jgi:hypothetical protein
MKLGKMQEDMTEVDECDGMAATGCRALGSWKNGVTVTPQD